MAAVPSPSTTRGSLALAGLGLALLALCLVLAFSGRIGAPHACPPPPQQAPDTTLKAYSAQKEIRLGERLCLGLNVPVFFAAEARAWAEIDRLNDEVKAARKAQAAAEAKAAPLSGEARTAADKQVQAAIAATKAAEKSLADGKAASGQVSPLREVSLFIDGEKAPGKAVEVHLGRDKGWVWKNFLLEGTETATSDDGKTWRSILGGFTRSGDRAVAIALATAGADQKLEERETLPNIRLRVYDPAIFYVGLAGLLLFTLGIGRLGWDSSLLRDGGAGTQFSLGRVQMAWWLVLVTGGFLFTWLVTEQWRDVVTAGVVALLGISASTGVAARLADDAPAAIPSAGFWQDLVDYRPGPPPQGPALHRVQLVLWTLILSAIFVWTLFSKLAFADFDTNLLLLMGIAGGTYVGFKFKE
jgi:hypothetical protein